MLYINNIYNKDKWKNFIFNTEDFINFDFSYNENFIDVNNWNTNINFDKNILKELIINSVENSLKNTNIIAFSGRFGFNSYSPYSKKNIK